MNSQSVSIDEHIKYKYLISVDGNTAAWQRVPWILQSGSVLLLVDTDIEEWFYSDLKAWEHYVPIKADFSDLIEKIEWLRKNDDEAKAIV